MACDASPVTSRRTRPLGNSAGCRRPLTVSGLPRRRWIDEFSGEEVSNPFEDPSAGGRPGPSGGRPADVAAMLRRMALGCGPPDDGDYEDYGGMSEEKRKEIMDMGLPDDGYDYTQHLRNMTARDESEDESEGEDEGKMVIGDLPKRAPPGAKVMDGANVFLEAPEVARRVEDGMLYSAKGLNVADITEEDGEDVDGRSREISALARPVEELRGWAARELAELEEAAHRLDGVDSDGDSDFFDDFVAKASANPGAREGSSGAAGADEPDEASEDDPSDSGSDVSSGFGDDDDGPVGADGRRLPFDTGSVASTAWMKPARNDRKEQLDMIDEQFEAMVLKEYEEEQFGDLESDEEGKEKARGGWGLNELEHGADAPRGFPPCRPAPPPLPPSCAAPSRLTLAPPQTCVPPQCWTSSWSRTPGRAQGGWWSRSGSSSAPPTGSRSRRPRRRRSGSGGRRSGRRGTRRTSSPRPCPSLPGPGPGPGRGRRSSRRRTSTGGRWCA